MKMPVLDGWIDRRILVNYRVKPEVVKSLLPSHLEPLVVNGYASAGICLLRLKDVGIAHSPLLLRITSENAAHRFLVKFREGERVMPGVYIPRRDTDSKLNVLLAGKLLSWPHFLARFQSQEEGGKYAVQMQSRDGYATVSVEAHHSTIFSKDSMFDSLDQASTCFKDYCVGISPSFQPDRFKFIRLETKTWSVQPLRVSKLSSSYFEDRSIFPEGSIQFDNALLMQGIQHRWLEERVS